MAERDLFYDKERIQEAFLVVDEWMTGFRIENLPSCSHDYRVSGTGIPLHGRAEPRIDIRRSFRNEAEFKGTAR